MKYIILDKIEIGKISEFANDNLINMKDEVEFDENYAFLTCGTILTSTKEKNIFKGKHENYFISDNEMKFIITLKDFKKAQKLENIFINVIENINNYYLQQLAVGFYHQLPKYFWYIPSSSTGKYHPVDEFCVGGQVIHTLRVVVKVKELAKKYNFNQKQTDMAIVAALFHDAFKQGDSEWGTGHTEHDHPVIAGEKLFGNSGIPVDKVIKGAIEAHSGLHTTSPYSNVVLPSPKTLFEEVVHMADSIVSKRDAVTPIDSLGIWKPKH